MGTTGGFQAHTHKDGAVTLWYYCGDIDDTPAAPDMRIWLADGRTIAVYASEAQTLAA